MSEWHVIHENFHTKHSVLTAPDEHMPYIIQLHIMSIWWAYYEQMKQQNRETERRRWRRKRIHTHTEYRPAFQWVCEKCGPALPAGERLLPHWMHSWVHWRWLLLELEAHSLASPQEPPGLLGAGLRRPCCVCDSTATALHFGASLHLCLPLHRQNVL